MVNPITILKKVNPEFFIWISALLMLALLDPDSKQVSLCPLKFMGFHYCPGCGLGHSIALLFRGRFSESFSAHPLGAFAIAMIGFRIVQLSRTAMLNKNEGNDAISKNQKTT